MAFVSSQSHGFSGSGTMSFSQAVSAGDVLLVVFTARRFSVDSGEATLSRLQVPEGWQRLGQIWDGRASGSPTSKDMAAMAVWHRATSTGTVSATFTWPGPVTWPADAHVLRYSGMRGVRGVAWQRSSWGVEFPAVSLPSGQVPSPAGHSVRIAVTGRTPNLHEAYPSGHVSRLMQVLHSAWIGMYQRYESHGVVVSDESLSNATPGQVRASVSAGTSWGVTIYLASTHGPKAPTLDLSPGVHDLSRAWTLGWTPDGAQTGVRVTRQALDSNGQPTGSVEYLSSVSSPAWTTSATTITTAATSVAFPAGHWPAAGARYRITVATVGDAAAPDLGDTASVDVESWQGPTATTVKAGTISSGTITTRTPWLVVEGSPGSGAALDLCQVQAVEEGTGRVLAEGTHGPGWWYEVPATPEQALPNGVSFRVRGRVRQRGVQWSDWITSGVITVDAPRPPTPTVTAHPVTHPVSGLPGIGVTVTSVAGDVTLRRDGEVLDTWESPGTLTIEDYAPPTDTEVVYSATVSTGSPLPEESQPATATAILPTTGESGHCWLIDPLDPATAVQAHCVEITEATTLPGATYRALSPTAPVRPITHVLPHWTTEGTLTVAVDTPDELAAVKTLLLAGRPLVFRRWVETDLRHPGQSYPQPPLRFVPQPGQVPVERPAPGPWTWRHITVTWAAT